MKIMDKWHIFKNKHLKTLNIIRDFSVLIFASICIAAGIEIFLAPNNMNAGGFIGISQIINYCSKGAVSIGILFILLNIPIFILLKFFFSNKFIFKTIFEVILIGVLMVIFRKYDVAALLKLNDKSNLSLIALTGGALVAIGIAKTLSIEGSSGGTDIIGLILQKKFKMSNISRFLLLIDIIVIAIYSFILDSIQVFFYSFTSLAAYQITLELVFNSYSNAVMFEIITEDSSKLIKALNEDLNRGATLFKAVGTYTKNNKEVVICVVRKRQETKARDMIKKIVPDCFAYTLPIKEVIGKGFRNINL